MKTKGREKKKVSKQKNRNGIANPRDEKSEKEKGKKRQNNKENERIKEREG